MSIAYALRLGLGPTNPEMITMAQETLLLRPRGFSPQYERTGADAPLVYRLWPPAALSSSYVRTR